MLIYQHNSNILPLRCESIESACDGRGFSLGVHDQIVLLRVWRVCDVLQRLSISVNQFERWMRKEDDLHQLLRVICQLLSPIY